MVMCVSKTSMAIAAMLRSGSAAYGKGRPRMAGIYTGNHFNAKVERLKLVLKQALIRMRSVHTMSVSGPRWTGFLDSIGVVARQHIVNANVRTPIPALPPVHRRKWPVQIRRSADPAINRLDAG
jgi:hypothetical protein